MTITLLLFYITILASAQIKDTINISDSVMKIYYSSFTINGSNSVINGNSVSVETVNKFMVIQDSVNNFLNNVAYGNYCKFYNEDSLLIEEGVWYDEIWAGNYKKYYSNEVIKEEREYSDKISGKKEGIWKYYSVLGILEYEEKYLHGEIIRRQPKSIR